MNTIEFLRQYRFGEYAIFDFVISFVGIYLLSPLLSKLFLTLGIKIPKVNWLYLTIPISILAHLLVGEITPMTRNFIESNGHAFLKVVVIVLFVLGMRGIKIIKRKA
jgi:hypothetical protein